jgi:RNA recognition motif-containing protein
MKGENGKEAGREVDWSPLRLYLGGIPLECQEKDLRQYFEKFCQVLCTGINRNKEGHPRGCGYVVLFSENHNKDEELILRKQHIIMGKQIEVKKYVECEKERQRLLQEDNEKAVHVCGLPLEATEKDISDYFSKFGKIERAYIICKDGKSRGFGFIRYFCPKTTEKVLSQEHLILGKKVLVQRKIAKNEMKKESTKSSGSKSMAQSTSGMGSWGDNYQGCNQQVNMGYGNMHPNHPNPYQQMNYGPQSQCVMINGVPFAPVGLGAPQNVMPMPMNGQFYGGQGMGGGYMCPQMGGYPMQAMQPVMYNMGAGQCWPQPAPYTNPYSYGHPQKPTFQQPVKPGTRHDYHNQGAYKANSACGSMPAKIQQQEEFNDTYSTISKQVCYSAQGAQAPNVPAREEQKEECFFERMRKQYCPFGKKYGFNPNEKNLAPFTNKKSTAYENLKGKPGGCAIQKPKGDDNEGCQDNPDKAIRDLFSDSES